MADEYGDFGGETPPPAPDEEHRYPCPQCGSDLRFDSAHGALSCTHCGYQASIEGDTSKAEATSELDFHAALDAQIANAEMEDTRVASCPGCGAQVTLEGASHSSECPFCATPVVTDTGTHRQIKPKALLPFAISESDARASMGKWLGKLWFAPNGLKEYARKGRKMQGIYVPYWTFDADTQSTYVGERGTEYYVTRTVTRDGKQEQVREQKVRWSPASGRVARFFDDILILASKSLPKRYTDALEPWDLEALEPYRPEFLAGYGAEGYTVELEEGYDQARDVMDSQIRSDVRRNIGGDRQRIHQINTSVSDVTFKHILLPIWTAAYKFRGKSYRFVVNGRTGEVKGERPWSIWKIAIAVVVVAIIGGVIAYFVAQNQ
jgi:DNA-directed RNA polymerase subunit RPC12/RpoP